MIRCHSLLVNKSIFHKFQPGYGLLINVIVKKIPALLKTSDASVVTMIC